MIEVSSLSNEDLDAIALEQDNPSGEAVLRSTYDFLSRFIAHPHDHARIAHTLWIAHTHLIEAFDATPRLAFLSAEPASGKTRALEITELLVLRPIEAVNVSPAALFRLVGQEEGLPTILFDEIDALFGPKAKEHEELRGLLNAGHRRGAKTYRCIVVGKKVEVEAIEAFCPVALAGLGWLPDTLQTRSVIVRMKRRAPGETVEPFRRRDYLDQGHRLRDLLSRWAESARAEVSSGRPVMPKGIEDRAADVWEPLLAVADAAGGDWPELARAAALATVQEGRDDHLPSLGLQLLADLKAIWGDASARASDDLLTALRGLPESPWNDLKGKPIDARRLANLLRAYGVKSRTVRIGTTTPKGYVRDDLEDAWSRNLQKSATSATSATNVAGQALSTLRQPIDVADQAPQVADTEMQKPLQNGHVADVADVADWIEERAAVLEIDGGLPRAEAEAQARREALS